MNKRILVTGAAGFIGSHLVDALLDDQNWVLCLDSFTDYYNPILKINNVTSALQHPNCFFLNEDILDTDLVKVLHEHQIDQICHLAGQPGVRSSWGHQFEIYVQNNVLVTQVVLEAALSAGSIPVIYASSSSVYGDLPTMPLTEDTTPAPISPYGVTKLAGEHLCSLYSKMHGIPTVSLRLFTVFGPRQRPEMAFSRFLDAVRMDKDIIIYGDGLQIRDYSYVGDVVRAFQLAIDFCQLNQGEEGRGWLFNVVGENRVHLLEILDIIAEVTSCRPRVRHLPSQTEDKTDSWADGACIRQALNYSPSVSLWEGISQQWRYLWDVENITMEDKMIEGVPLLQSLRS
jgi:UDP-glucuronate 4-epimerase